MTKTGMTNTETEDYIIPFDWDAYNPARPVYMNDDIRGIKERSLWYRSLNAPAPVQKKIAKPPKKNP